jgi:hypothetical protein
MSETAKKRLLWRWTLTGVVLVCLVVSLATRFHGAVQHTATAHTPTLLSVPAQGTHQHMDRDAVRWADPVLAFTLLQAPTFHPRVVQQAQPAISTFFPKDNLYKRPPPAC